MPEMNDSSEKRPGGLRRKSFPEIAVSFVHSLTVQSVRFFLLHKINKKWKNERERLKNFSALRKCGRSEKSAFPEKR
jgi:hypothetical protein